MRNLSNFINNVLFRVLVGIEDLDYPAKISKRLDMTTHSGISAVNHLESFGLIETKLVEGKKLAFLTEKGEKAQNLARELKELIKQ